MAQCLISSPRPDPADRRFSLLAGVKPNRRLRVLLNPIGGRGKAKQLWETEISPVLRAAACVVKVERELFFC